MATSANTMRRTPADRFFEFSLLGLLASGFLAVAGSGYLDRVAVAVTSAGLLARGLMTGGWLRLGIPPRAVFALALGYIGFYPVDYYFLSRDFLAATVHLICFLAVVRILSAETERDYFFVKLIAFLEIVAASVLSENLNYFPFLALFLVFGVATFSSAEIRRSGARSQASWRVSARALSVRLAGITVLAAAGILIITAGLFFFLPRTARAAFQHLVPENYRLPGFSSEVRLGQTGEIRRQGTVVMRARIEGVTKAMNLKWRGAALADFNGLRWFNGTPDGELLRVKDGLLQLADNKQRRRKGMRIAYEVHVRPMASDVLFFAGIPEFVRLSPRLVVRTPTNSYKLGYRTGEPLRYFAYSFLEEGAFEEAPALSDRDLETYLRLPAQDPRLLPLARQVTAGAHTPAERARSLESWLRKEFRYTLELPKESSIDPVADFLFTRRQGHCEYFASSMAVMLRLLWIPSRVVTGFQSGVLNPLSGWYVIRDSDAHSWVEAWLPDRGWTTFDPTPPAPGALSQTLWSRLSLYVDAAEVFWQDWVLNYDLDRQILLAAKMEQSGQGAGSAWLDRFDAAIAAWKSRLARWSWVHLVAIACLLAALGTLAAAARPAWRALQLRRQRRRIERGEVMLADATLLYNRMLALLSHRGFEKPVWFTPLEFARALPSSDAAQLVRDITLSYNDLRFGGRREAGQRMLELIEALEHAPFVHI